MTRLFRLIVVLLSVVALAGCGGSGDGDEGFIKEYEDLNGMMTQRGTAFLEVEIPDDHVFSPASEDEARGLLDDGHGVIYFGFPSCPWCRNAVGPMDEAAKESGIEEIHYVNVSQIRDGQEGADYYAFLLEELGEFAPEYPTEEDPGARRILVPLVAAVVDGEVVGSHLGSAPSQTDPSVALSDSQREELIGLYTDLFSAVP
ncbi:hypothetical protein EJ997_12695 [Flaviflexus ciconiae]|uniref:Thioredoxin n=1 Tax=Flaviflexus ciconiae TaxID=2496867 RepID=A0A3Q9G3G7_9ACTO|nr:hypothetical protein [Flaviflexus ciconiae]AZQ78065.1 hypothetical protein EJ997_12695 [Flaviflexus ciconiae]